MNKIKIALYNRRNDLALLFVRAGVGILLFSVHGYEKLFRFTEMQQRFPDPLSLGQTASLILALLADSIFSLLVMVGLFTRIASAYISMSLLIVSLFIWKLELFNIKAELSLLYLVVYFTIFLAGPGRFSVDHWLEKRKKI